MPMYRELKQETEIQISYVSIVRNSVVYGKSDAVGLPPTGTANSHAYLVSSDSISSRTLEASVAAFVAKSLSPEA